ncbi:transglycosylase domain-containing protein [Sphaerotilus uruguayifluvii]|uniref:Penicillin-binding protein 1A n=1 Tax=Sphaerotilus uruguayifluvii TaxID=2735897 RepID=A0ABX2G124_9BURK|nr:penicillin-binding protein 1A [Leptothrix sp. C29]
MTKKSVVLSCPKALRVTLTLLLVLMLAGGAALAVALARLWPQLPPLDRVLDYQPRQPLQVYTLDGVPITQFGEEHREFVPIERIPPLLRQAVLAVEDRRFERHPGVDLIGIARALRANLVGDGLRQGGSTITQQVARTFFLTPNRTLERKLREALLALQIEHRLDKARILELYMNQIYLGQRSYGFAAAARTYFGKPLQALTLAETAMLAGLPQNPSYANPVVNPARARARQRLVLQRMQQAGLIDAVARAEAEAEPLAIRLPLQAEVHAEHLAELVRRQVVARLGESVYTQGYRIYTTVTAAEQRAAHAALRRSLLEHERQQPWRGPEGHETLPEVAPAALGQAASQLLRDHADDEDLRVALVTATRADGLSARLASGEAVELGAEGVQRIHAALQPQAPDALAVRRGAVVRLERREIGGRLQWSVAQWPQVEGAFVALDTASGRVRALVGGFDPGRAGTDHATGARRPAGLMLRPFVLSAALASGVTPDARISDASLGSELTVTAAGPAASAPADPGIAPADLLRASHPRAALRLAQHLGAERLPGWLMRYGFDAGRMPADAAELLDGSATTTPLELARAWTVLARAGADPVTPVLIDRVTDATGVVIYRPPPLPPHDPDRPAVEPRNIFLLGTMLSGAGPTALPDSETAPPLRADLLGQGCSLAGSGDSWFAGVHSQVAAVAWIGPDGTAGPAALVPQPVAVVRAREIWSAYMAGVLAEVPVWPPQPPPGLVRQGETWRYSEQADGEAPRIGFAPPGPAALQTAAEPPALTAAPAAASAAPAL